jgi:hypothetical protein
MVVVVNEVVAGWEVPLRGFCCKARGGGGRLRQATKREHREKRRERREEEARREVKSRED